VQDHDHVPLHELHDFHDVNDDHADTDYNDHHRLDHKHDNDDKLYGG
jgi:hypothetical protein